MKSPMGIGVVLFVLVCVGALAGCPRYNVYYQEMQGRAKLAEAHSSRQVAILEARAKMESASRRYSFFIGCRTSPAA